MQQISPQGYFDVEQSRERWPGGRPPDCKSGAFGTAGSSPASHTKMGIPMAPLKAVGPRLKTLDTRTCRPPPKQADAELLTPEHRAWALEVKTRARWRCEDCGARGGKGGVRLYADHIKERKDGGALLDPANGRCRCPPCHQRKTAAERARRLGAPAGNA